MLAGLTALACARGEARPAAVPAWIEPGGCAVLRQGPACDLPADRKLRAVDPGRGGAPGPHRPGAAGAGRGGTGGRRPALPADSAGGGRLAGDRAERRRRAGDLAAGAAIDAPAGDPGSGRKALGQERREAEAEALLRRALPALEPEARGQAWSLLGRLALQRGDLPAAIDGSRSRGGAWPARPGGRRTGCGTSRRWCSCTRSSSTTWRGRRRCWIEAAGDLRGHGWAPITARARLAAMTARVAEDAGDLRGALAAMRTAEALDRRMGEDRLAPLRAGRDRPAAGGGGAGRRGAPHRAGAGGAGGPRRRRGVAVQRGGLAPQPGLGVVAGRAAERPAPRRRGCSPPPTPPTATAPTRTFTSTC